MSVTTTKLKYLCVDGGQYGLNVPASDYVLEGEGLRLIRTTDLPPQVVRHANAPPIEHNGTLPVGQTLDAYISEQEKRYIEETIKFNAGSREKAAKMLGISMATLYRKLEIKKTAEKG